MWADVRGRVSAVGRNTARVKNAGWGCICRRIEEIRSRRRVSLGCALYWPFAPQRKPTRFNQRASGRARRLRAWKLEGEAEFGNDMQYLPLVLVPDGREFRGWSWKPQLWWKKSEERKLAKKPTMPRVCLDAIRDRCANIHIQRLSPCTTRKQPLCTAFGQSMGACYVMWESLSNQLACLHEINSGREKRISSPDTIRLVVDSQACYWITCESETSTSCTF